jgi:hypothetical protein
MRINTPEPKVTQSDVDPARTPIIVMEHARTGPGWVCVYMDKDELETCRNQMTPICGSGKRPCLYRFNGPY